MRRFLLKSALFGVDPILGIKKPFGRFQKGRERGEDEIRTHGRGLTPYTGLANQRDRPLRHLSLFQIALTRFKAFQFAKNSVPCKQIIEKFDFFVSKNFQKLFPF